MPQPEPGDNRVDAAKTAQGIPAMFGNRPTQVIRVAIWLADFPQSRNAAHADKKRRHRHKAADSPALQLQNQEARR